MQVAAEDFDRLGFRRFAQLHQELGADMQVRPNTPGPLTNVGQPLVGRTAAIFDAEVRRDHCNAGMWDNRF